MKKILIIDDDMNVRDLVGGVLEKEGYEVILVKESKDCFDTIINKKPDFILLDLIMPGLDGFMVLEELKKRQIAAGIPIVILTALSGDFNAKKALDLGASDYWVKSDYDLNQIVDKIKAKLETSQGQSIDP